MGRPRVERKTNYKGYYDKGCKTDEIPESTERSKKARLEVNKHLKPEIETTLTTCSSTYKLLCYFSGWS